MPLPPAVKKLRTLAQIAARLQEGDHFDITRLTTLKGFCEDPEADPIDVIQHPVLVAGGDRNRRPGAIRPEELRVSG